MYKDKNLPQIKGFSKKIAGIIERLKAERINLSIGVGVDYLAQSDSEALAEAVSLLETTEAKLKALSRKFKIVIKALEK